MIALVDYGLGNLASVRNAFRAVGVEIEVTSDPERMERAHGLVLPGVGAASAGMERLRRRGLEGAVRRAVAAETPLLGICLGMQLLFDRSEEGGVACLGLVPGQVRRLSGARKVPHMGWNQVTERGDSALWEGIDGDPYMYFVHSFVCEPERGDVSAGTTEYGERFCSAVALDGIWGTQFHPERSGRVGLRLIRNFARHCGAAPEMGKLQKSTARF